MSLNPNKNMRNFLGFLVLSLVPHLGLIAQAAPSEMGVVVMAHGGSPEWNESVELAVRPLSERVPTEIAFGMAEPVALTAALDALRVKGVERVAVVRLFMSARSFERQTLYLLGLTDDRPDWFMTLGDMAPDSVRPIRHGLLVATHQSGLMGSRHAADIVIERVEHESVSAADEGVLLMAHGMGDEKENEEVVAAMGRVASELRGRGFAFVETATLREDWPDQRVEAQALVRGVVERGTTQGGRMIVAPFRLSGFGPYAKVLDGLAYVPTPGLLPHAAISRWLVEVAGTIACEQGWNSSLGRCDTEW